MPTERTSPTRRLIGIAGPPAAGKTTLAARIAAQNDAASILSMDGFHLDDRILKAHGDLARKGAPHTFDVAGFVAMLVRLRAGETVFAPLFDRSMELSRAGAIEIGPDIATVVVEGNYLLHDEGGWEAVRPLLDECWFLDLPELELANRLNQRWEDAKLPAAEVTRRLEENDLPNARVVAQGRERADRVIGPNDPI